MRIKLGRSVLSTAAVAVLLVTTGFALAASPLKGTTYTGTIKRASSVTYGIGFKVSANGKTVSGFTLSNGYPVYCQGGGFGEMQAASAKITKKGTFKVKLPIYFAPSHQHQGLVIVTGAFAKHGKVSGKVQTDFTKAKVCNGSSSYTAVG